MPGITGIIRHRITAEDRVTVEAMTLSMVHEEFYSFGVESHESLGIAMGWVAQMGAADDGGPVWNEARNIGLVFAGEEFTNLEPISGESSPPREGSRRKALQLLRRYEKSGERFIEDLNGCFSGVILDCRRSKVVLFNDRYGLSRLFVHETADELLFASEAKSLLSIRPELRRLDPRSLAESIVCGCVLQGRTLFQGIHLLPGASVWRFSQGRTNGKRTYFHPETWERLERLPAEEYRRRVTETWDRVLPRYLDSSQPVGLSLTGGVDSRMILAWARKPPGTFPCYTWGGSYRDSADVRLSRRIADIAEQPHHTLRLDQSFFTGFTEIAERAVFLSDGSMDVTGSIDLYLQKKARQIAPIRISGVYGGELLRRLVVFRPMRLAGEVFSSELAHAMGNAARTYSEELSGHLLSFSLFKQAPWYMTGKFAIERSQVTFRTPYFDNDLAALAYQSPPEEQRRHDLSLHVTAGANRRMAALRTDRGPGLYAGPVLGRIQRALGELTFKAEYAFDYGMPQRLARIDGFIRPFHLEKLFLGRHKFHHFRVWYRDRLSHNVREVLLDARTRNRPYLQPRILERMVTDHLAGRANRTLDLHRLLTLEIIERTLIEGGSSIARRESFLRERSLTVSA